MFAHCYAFITGFNTTFVLCMRHNFASPFLFVVDLFHVEVLVISLRFGAGILDNAVPMIRRLYFTYGNFASVSVFRKATIASSSSCVRPRLPTSLFMLAAYSATGQPAPGTSRVL